MIVFVVATVLCSHGLSCRSQHVSWKYVLPCTRAYGCIVPVHHNCVVFHVHGSVGTEPDVVTVYLVDLRGSLRVGHSAIHAVLSAPYKSAVWHGCDVLHRAVFVHATWSDAWTARGATAVVC